MKRLNEIFENDDKKVTIRYVAGGAGFALCGAGFVLGGFQFYEIDKGIFDSFLTGSITLILGGVISKFAPKK